MEPRIRRVEAAFAAEARSQATEFKSSLLRVEESARRQLEEGARKLPVASEPMGFEDPARARRATQLEQEVTDAAGAVGRMRAQPKKQTKRLTMKSNTLPMLFGTIEDIKRTFQN